MLNSQQYIDSSQNQTQQHSTMKRTMAQSAVNIFQDLTAKTDLYDHLKNTLQVRSALIFH